MSVSQPRTLPAGIPPGLVAQLAQRMVGPGAAPPQPMPAPPPQGPPEGPSPGIVPAPAPQQAPPPQGQQGPPQPGQSAQENEQGLTPELAETLRDLMRDKKARADILAITRQITGEQNANSALKLDPALRMKLAQGWNARIASSGRMLAATRGSAPGSTKASDEALLRIYWTTPEGVELEDVENYANAVRQHLIMAVQMTDEDAVEDTTMRWCFPLRELQIKAGRPEWRERVEFVNQMLDLTTRWLEEYGALPEPDWKVIRATEAGKGDPESQARDTDSDAFPPGTQKP